MVRTVARSSAVLSDSAESDLTSPLPSYSPEMDPDHRGGSVDPHDGAAELRRRIEESRVRYRLDELVGMTVAERAVVEDAGGMFVTDDGALAAMFSPHRVVASVADGR
jgi:hypothetical protein